MMKKRLDQLMVERDLAPSRTQAQALIMAGKVFSGDKRVNKPGALLMEDVPLSLKGESHGYVSRGGLKLAHALDHFNISPEGLVGLDIGASTGGFTDVLLKRGARRVYAVDVGYGQLAWEIRNNQRVVVMEKTNARFLTQTLIPEPPKIIVCDASFIGLRTVLPASLALATSGTKLVVLIKPQFEVGRERVGKGGIVRDPDLHQEVCESITTWLAEDMKWKVLGLVPSPIQGAEGNVEFLIAAEKV
ncbi:MAG: TlyA family RNA methyltransferase [Proteobacteria bacterium]|nr:TlyA family RNA methyltransferase [Pseudomonadota bacterium]